jgi:hypothetical protein
VSERQEFMKKLHAKWENSVILASKDLVSCQYNSEMPKHLYFSEFFYKQFYEW